VKSTFETSQFFSIWDEMSDDGSVPLIDILYPQSASSPLKTGGEDPISQSKTEKSGVQSKQSKLPREKSDIEDLETDCEISSPIKPKKLKETKLRYKNAFLAGKRSNLFNLLEIEKSKKFENPQTENSKIPKTECETVEKPENVVLNFENPKNFPLFIATDASKQHTTGRVGASMIVGVASECAQWERLIFLTALLFLILHSFENVYKFLYSF
jgi:hypothetical protein